MSALRRGWAAWVGLWDGVEHPRTLGLVRLLLGAVILFDFLQIWHLDLVVPLFGVQEAGGLSDAMARKDLPWFYEWLAPTPTSARLLHMACTLAAFSFTVGFFTRTSAAALILLWAQFAHVLPGADRGIDTLCRDVLCVYAFARGGEWLGIDAWMRTGRLQGDGTPIPAWARRLLVLQLVAMYFLAGIQKVGIHWWPMGHWAALYFVLQDPAIARFDFRWLAQQPWFLLTQLGTVGTILFQDSYPVVLLFRWWRTHPGTGGRWAAFALRWKLEWVWIATGALFHLLLAWSCELGIFPWAMLALYPVWLHPDELGAALDRLRRRAASPASATA